MSCHQIGAPIVAVPLLSAGRLAAFRLLSPRFVPNASTVLGGNAERVGVPSTKYNAHRRNVYVLVLNSRKP